MYFDCDLLGFVVFGKIGWYFLFMWEVFVVMLGCLGIDVNI